MHFNELPADGVINSKVEEYVDSFSVEEGNTPAKTPSPPLVRIVSSPSRNVEIIVNFTKDRLT